MLLERMHRPTLETLASPDVRGQEVRLWESQTGKSARDRTLSRIVLVAIVVTAVLLRVWNLGRYSLWYDEVFSVVAARSSWSEMFRQILIDRVHPPLFYICLKVWIAALGESVIRLRVFSVCFSVLTLLPMWICMKRVKLSSELSLGLLFAIACNPFLIFYGQEVRMYALLGFLSTCSLAFYLSDKRSRSELSLLSCVNTLLVLTHAAGVAVVGCELCHALFGKNARKRDAAIACGPALLAFGCWIVLVKAFAPHPAMAVHNVSWIPRPTLAVGWKVLAHILGGAVALVVLNIPIALAWKKGIRDSQFALFSLLSLATVVFIFAFSVAIRPVWQERYLIICVIPYYLLAGWSVARLSRRLKVACVVAIGIAALVSLEYELTHRADRPDFDSFVAIMKARQAPVLASYDILASPIAFEMGDGARSQVQVVKSIADQKPGDPTFVTRDIAYSVGQRDWIRDQRVLSARKFLYAWDNSADPLLPGGVKPADLSSKGCQLQELAKTHGEGHKFTLFSVDCRQISQRSS